MKQRWGPEGVTNETGELPGLRCQGRTEKWRRGQDSNLGSANQITVFNLVDHMIDPDSKSECGAANGNSAVLDGTV